MKLNLLTCQVKVRMSEWHLKQRWDCVSDMLRWEWVSDMLSESENVWVSDTLSDGENVWVSDMFSGGENVWVMC